MGYYSDERVLIKFCDLEGWSFGSIGSGKGLSLLGRDEKGQCFGSNLEELMITITIDFMTY